MPHNRYYCPTPFAENEAITLNEEEAHHLIRVLRAQVGDHVELVNGQGQLAEAAVIEIGKHKATLQVNKLEHMPPKPPLILAMAIPRMNHLEWVIEKGTELNATGFWLFPGLLSEKETISPNQLQRLNALAIAAMKQCGRLDLPSIECKPPLLQWQSMQGTLFFGDLADKAPYLWELKRPLSPPIILFIGPEKGWEPRERVFLREKMGAKGVRLHPNILRTETAPLVGLSLIQSII